MIQFLVTAVIVVIGVFLLTLLLCLMIWVITKLLRFLFPHRFGAAAPELPKVKKGKKGKEVKLEYRCMECNSFGRCPIALTEVKYPCKFYSDKEVSLQE